MRVSSSRGQIDLIKWTSSTPRLKISPELILTHLILPKIPLVPGTQKTICHPKEPGSTKINISFILLGKHLQLATSSQPPRVSTMLSKPMPCMSPMLAQLSSGEMAKFSKCGEIKISYVLQIPCKLWLRFFQLCPSRYFISNRQSYKRPCSS